MKQLAAALIFFTRLPLWRVVRVPDACYRRVVAYWSATGWLTAAVTAGVLYGAAFLLPVPAAVLAAVIARVLLTGALHEDGLSDFLDGFGGGRTREQTLAIMKDSRTGSYGIIGLILYFGLLVALLASLPVPVACAAVLCGDPFCKFVASMTINFLPYARPAAQSKSGVVYAPMRVGEIVCGAAFGADAVAVLSALLACRACAVRVHCVAYSTDATPYRRVHGGLLRCGIPVVRGLVLCGFGRFIPILWKRYWCGIPRLTFRRAFATDGRMCR